MRLFSGKAGAAVFGLVWIICTVAWVILRSEGGALPLFWLPTALSVAALFSAPKGERHYYLVAMIIGDALVNTWFGLSLSHSLAYIVVHVIEPVVAVAIARKVMRGRHFDALNLRDLVLLFLGAVFSAMLAAIMAHPFQPEAGLLSLCWRIFASALGTSMGAPVLIAIAHWIRRQNGGWRAMLRDVPVTFLLAQQAMFALSLWVVSTSAFSLTQLVLAALVFNVVRYGQVAGSSGVFLFGVAGTIQSIGGDSPAAYLNFPQDEAGIILQGFMLLMLTTCLPLAALLTRKKRLALHLKVSNARLRQNLLLLNMAEEIGRIGRWRYDPRSGIQDWSRQMYIVNGLDPGRAGVSRNLMDHLPDGGQELFANLASHCGDQARYSFEYRITTHHGDERILKMYATNEFSDEGELTCIYGVVMDVTEHHQRQEALDNERTRAMRLAAEAQYLAHTDPLTGLANRRRTLTQLEKCIGHSVRVQRPFGIIYFDIDHFKRVNDTYGHMAGDDVLVRIAEIARQQSRASDLIGRMGGEEFTWLLPDVGPGETRNAALRLRQAIESESGKNGLPGVTASVGYAVWREGDDVGTLLARVDAALYAAKEAGRNTVKKAA